MPQSCYPQNIPAKIASVSPTTPITQNMFITVFIVVFAELISS